MRALHGFAKRGKVGLICSLAAVGSLFLTAFGACQTGASSLRLQRPQPLKQVGGQEVDSPGVVPFAFRVCAFVNGQPIFTNEVYREAAPELFRLKGVPEPDYSKRRKKILQDTLKRLIDREVVYQEAYGKLKDSPSFLKKITTFAHRKFEDWVARQRQERKLSDEQFREQLRRQGTSYETLREKVVKDVIVSEYLRSRTMGVRDQITYSDLYDYYRTHLSEFRTEDEVDWEDLFIASGTKRAPTMTEARLLAQQLAEQLKAGAPVSRFLGYDDGDASTRGGKGLGKRRGEIRPRELESHLFSMQPGEVRLVQIPTGIHVVRLIQRRNAGLLPFDAEVQSRIRARLLSDLLKREYDRVIRQLAARAVIDVVPDAFRN